MGLLGRIFGRNRDSGGSRGTGGGRPTGERSQRTRPGDGDRRREARALARRELAKAEEESRRAGYEEPTETVVTNPGTAGTSPRRGGTTTPISGIMGLLEGAKDFFPSEDAYTQAVSTARGLGANAYRSDVDALLEQHLSGFQLAGASAAVNRLSWTEVSPRAGSSGRPATTTTRRASVRPGSREALNKFNARKENPDKYSVSDPRRTMAMSRNLAMAKSLGLYK